MQATTATTTTTGTTSATTMKFKSFWANENEMPAKWKYT